jgi:hypothetical protein
LTATEIADLLKGRKCSSGWIARCPAHEDKQASLSIGQGHDGCVLVHCHAGCTPEQIVSKVSLTMADLFPKGAKVGVTSVRHAQHCNTPSTGCTLADYSAAKHIPVEALKRFGVAEIKIYGAPALRMIYRHADGTEAAIRFRTALRVGQDGPPRFTWKVGSKPLPYGLDRLATARSKGYAVLVEGESDCHTLWLHEEPALGLPGAATWNDIWAAHLDGIPVIYAVMEPDRGGDVLFAKLSRSEIRDRVQIVTLGQFKDVSDLHIAGPDQFPAAWQAARLSAEALTVHVDRKRSVLANAAWARCATLATQPNILACLDDSLARLGVVGERRAARLIYLATTSRMLDRIVSVAVKGPSSGGKSHITAAVLRHFPASAYYAMTGMSERALAYSEEPLAHRMLVIYEAAGMMGDFASYLVRSLLSEGCIRYEVVEKTKDGLRPRLIERAGPTGLLTTTTAVHLHPENETRLLSIPVTDTQDQTRQVLLAQSAEHDCSTDGHLQNWHALQEWIESTEHRVELPFASALAAAIPPIAVRLRRDFPTVLSLIKAHALLHQATREKTADGSIVATIEDYAAVRELVVELLDVAVAQTVSPATRQTVEMVRTLAQANPAGLSLGTLATALKLDKSTVARRVAVATADGYLVNQETAKGKPARLVIGEPLPDQVSLLPDPLVLSDRCTVAGVPPGTNLPPPVLTGEVDTEADDGELILG